MGKKKKKMSLTPGKMELQLYPFLVVIFKYLVSIYCFQKMFVYDDGKGDKTQNKWNTQIYDFKEFT